MVLREHGHRDSVYPAEHAPIQREMAVLDLHCDLRVQRLAVRGVLVDFSPSVPAVS